MLVGKGFDEVYNLSGGIKGWNSETAFGGEELGLDFFTGDESPEQTLVVAYSLEDGLRDFYLSMIPRVKNDDAKNLAMSIEAQALDLYTRVAERTEIPQSKKALMQIADEERAHLTQLGKLLDTI